MKKSERTVRWIFLVTVAMMTVSGFGQMPIFKRYYIADLPGLAWTGNYYITHYMHYTGAVILLTLCAYLCAAYIISGRISRRLTRAGLAGTLIFIILIASGALKVLSSARGVYFGRNLLISLDMAHTLFTFLLLITAALSAALRKPWIEERQ
jgi:hypothetical protein